MRTEKIFQILALLLFGVAAYFFWEGNSDLAFFFLVLAACSFFLGVRSQAKARMAALEGSGDEDTKPQH